jgi:hypothetical protein
VGQFVALAGDLSIHRIRREIDLTGPGDRTIIDKVRQKKSWVDSGSGNLPSE